MKYKFLGKPDIRFPDLVNGKVYDLVIVTRTKFGSMFSYKYPQIIKPFRCPYSSWETFYKNWKPINN